MQKRLFGGCHLTRPIADLLTNAGFTITEVDVFYEKGAPKFLSADSLGVAAAPQERSADSLTALHGVMYLSAM